MFIQAYGITTHALCLGLPTDWCIVHSTRLTQDCVCVGPDGDVGGGGAGQVVGHWLHQVAGRHPPPPSPPTT